MFLQQEVKYMNRSANKTYIKNTKSTKRTTSILAGIGALSRARNLYFWFISIVHNKLYELYCYSAIRNVVYHSGTTCNYMCNEWLTYVISWPVAHAHDDYIPAESLQTFTKQDFSNVIAGLTALLGSILKGGLCILPCSSFPNPHFTTATLVRA